MSQLVIGSGSDLGGSASTDTFRVVQVSLQADAGGDGRVASNLHSKYLEQGYAAWLVVGRGTLPYRNMSLLPNDDYRTLWARFFLSLLRNAPHAPRNDRRKVAKVVEWMAEPRRRLRIRQGFEGFDYPATYPVISALLSTDRSILHCHNLHGDYFDLRALPLLSHVAPVVLTLHDAWTMSGHCGHSFNCQRWLTGCGECPDLSIYPGIPRDKTAPNWLRKKQIFAGSRLHVVTPCRWLKEKAERSLVSSSIAGLSVIPNGIDLGTFNGGDKHEARNRLNLPRSKTIILMVGDDKRMAQWMDLNTIDYIIRQIADGAQSDAIVVRVGSANGEQSTPGDNVTIHRPYTKDMDELADYYRSADVYVHPAREDTFPNAILESLACGTPVVSTAVGGIPEQVRTLDLRLQTGEAEYPDTTATGILARPGDSRAFMRGLTTIIHNPHLRERLGSNAATDAAARFDLETQVASYLDLYRSILGQWAADANGPASSTQDQTRSRRRQRIFRPQI